MCSSDLTLIKGGRQFKVMADPYQYNKKDYLVLSSNLEQSVDVTIKAPAATDHIVTHFYSYERYVADQKEEATYLQLTIAVPMGAGLEDLRTADVYLQDGEYFNLIRNTEYNLTVNIKSVDMTKLDIQCSITPWSLVDIDINSRPTSTVPLSNCYIVKTGSTINIPVAQANADGTQRIGVTDELEGMLVWDNGYVGPSGMTGGTLNANSQIETLEVIGVGSSALLSVKMGSENGNAVVAVRNKTTGKIRWSWHIWVTPYDPDVAMANFEFVRGITSATGNNDILSWYLDEISDGAGGRLYMYMYYNLGTITNTTNHQNDFLNGLNYQWGRKDPVGAWGGTFYPSLSNTTVSTLEGSIENPNSIANDPYFGAAAANKDLWEPTDGTKSIYDPCPIGWRLPKVSDCIDKVANHSFPISNAKQWWLSSSNNDTQRWSYDGSKGDYSEHLGAAHVWPVRCISEGSIIVPSAPEPNKNLVVNWNLGVINPLGSTIERERTTFSVTPSYQFDNGDTAPAPDGVTYTYTWYVDNSPQAASAGDEYTHTVSRFNDQSILLKCRVVDSEGRVGESSAEWMVMKRAFKNASLVTFNNAASYLASEAAFINQGSNRSRVRYLRAAESSNVYRVKLMSDGSWWMVQDYREGTVTNTTEGGVSIYNNASKNVCPDGWSLPTEARFRGIITTDYDNAVGMDEYNGNHFEAQVNVSNAASRYWTSADNRFLTATPSRVSYTTQSGYSNAVRCVKN